MAEEDSGVRIGEDANRGVRLPASARRTGAGRRDARRAAADRGEARRTVAGRRDARRRRRSLLITAFLSAAVLAASGVVWALPRYAAGQIGQVDAGTTGAESREPMNILLVGVDKRDDLTRRQQNLLHLGRQTGQRTDTMMVIHLSADRRRVTVVSLPRDTWAEIPGRGMHKINAAYQLGGAKLTVQTVQRLTGLPIHHYVEVNVLGFVDVVDALGGIRVCTPVPIDDAKTKFTLPAGTHELDGVQALFYARTRATARADLDRIDRQQQVISAMLHKAMSTGTLANPARLAGLVDSALRTLTVDRELARNLLGLAEQLKDVSTDDVVFATVPLAETDFRTPTGESAVRWDVPAAQELFRRIARDEPLTASSPAASPSGRSSAQPSARPSDAASARPSPSAPAPTIPPERIALRVLNGTGVPGAGARARADLIAAGFQVPEPAGNAARFGVPRTVIRYGPDRADSARTVAAALPGAELRQADISGIEVVVGHEHPKARKVTVAAVAPSATPSPSVTPSSAATPQARTATQKICD